MAQIVEVNLEQERDYRFAIHFQDRFIITT